MHRHLIFILLFLPLVATAGELSGIVVDMDSNTPLPFANVLLKDSQRGAISNREGEFRLDLRKNSASILIISYLGYETVEITVAPDRQNLRIGLKPKVLAEDPIVVTATRLRAHIDPLPLKNIDHETIEKRYWAQDPPLLLAETPGIYAYNESGSGIGNSYLTLRGFGQNRVAVMINGVPLNGGDSHEVWWVDLPDFAASLKDIQVQRGVMSGLYGGTALGGSINLLTDSFARERQLKFSQGMGSWATRKSTVEYSSGVLDESLSVNLRLSSIQSDGYREQSWTRSWAYYANLSHFGERTTTRFNFYGGPENTHLAYKGITREQLENDRRANPLSWEDEEDRFHQPHFELHNRWQIDSSRSLSNTLFFTKGDGYYEQFREGRDAFEYALADDPAETFDTDLVRRRTVDEWDAGWIPRFEQDIGAHKLGLGGELRLHDSHHFGDVQWALVYPASLPLYNRFYDYRVRKTAVTAYLQDRIDLSGGFALQAALQLQHHALELYEDERFGVSYQRDFSFLSPRLGLSWQPYAGQSYFASVAMGSRAPAHRDIYNAGDFWSGPGGEAYQEYWGNNDYVSHFENSGDGLDYIGPEAKPEKVLDLELGGRLNGRRFAFDWTLYWMDFRDEIVPYAGALDDNQYPNNGNAEHSRHTGLELGGKLHLVEGWMLTGAAAFTQDRFIKYTEYGYDWVDYEAIPRIYDGQTLPGYPVYSWNLRLDGSIGPASPWVSARGAGRQWLDGRNLESRSVDPYALLDAGFSFELNAIPKLKGLRLDLRVNNLLDIEYESSGYIEYDDWEPRYFVGGPRNWYAGLSVEL
jgi:iron complex outermembrane receptor protein